MLTEIMPGLFRIEVPLTGNPLRSVNSYIMPGEDHHLMVDAGLNRTECDRAIKTGLAELGIELSRTWFVATHLHADHIGLIWRWAAEDNAPARFLIGQADGERICNWQGWDDYVSCAAINGFPPDRLQESILAHPGYRFKAPEGFAVEYLKDGDRLECGDFQWSCIATPGHSRGHTCLYDPEKRLLLSGDHILGDITPNIECFSERLNPLADYLRSLEKVRKLDVSLVLPGHRSPIANMEERLDQLCAHHRQRLDEVLEILGSNSMHAYTVASRMSWDLDCSGWENFPPAQKWFAIGEAIAHLRYLESVGELQREFHNEVIFYRRRRGTAGGR